MNLIRREGGDSRNRDQRNLYQTLSNFSNAAQTLARNVGDIRRPEVRQTVRNLVLQGGEISRWLDREDPALREAWGAVDHELGRLADQFGEPINGPVAAMTEARGAGTTDAGTTGAGTTGAATSGGAVASTARIASFCAATECQFGTGTPTP